MEEWKYSSTILDLSIDGGESGHLQAPVALTQGNQATGWTAGVSIPDGQGNYIFSTPQNADLPSGPHSLLTSVCGVSLTSS
jgi:hypothetical protein